MKKKYIGDRAFYRRVFAVMVPVLIQQVITNFVSLLDNLMVGQLGTEPMSGVAIVNQLLFVFALSIFGALAGPGILTAQYFGAEDHKGVRNTFRAKLWLALGAVLVFGSLLILQGGALVRLFLHEGEAGLDLEETFVHAMKYLRVMLWQMLPFALVQVYAGTLRETGETVLPMKAGLAAVGVNLTGNYILIFGKLGLPALGVQGAAIATVLSRFVELGIVAVWTHRHTERCPYIVGAFRSMRVPGALMKRIAVLGLPLLINEVLWSSGMTTMNQCFSVRGLEVVSAENIAMTISNLFFCAFLSMGTTVSIMIGQLLGSGQTDRAIDEDRKLIAFAVALCTAVGVVMAVIAPLVPDLYNTTAPVRKLAVSLILINAAMMPINAFTNACYFTLRSGGKTFITFLFDSGFVWCISVPAAFVLCRYTSIPVVPAYVGVYLLDLIKCAIGGILVRSRSWVNNLVNA